MKKFLLNHIGELYVILCYMIMPSLFINNGVPILKDMAFFHYYLLVFVFTFGIFMIDNIPKNRPWYFLGHLGVFASIAMLLIMGGYIENTSYINLPHEPTRLSIAAFLIVSIFITVSAFALVIVVLLLMIFLYLWLWACKGSKPDIPLFPSFRKK